MSLFKTISVMATGALLAVAVFSTSSVEADLTTDTESMALFMAGDNVAMAASDSPGSVGPVGPSDGGSCTYLPFFNCYTPTGRVMHFLNDLW